MNLKKITFAAFFMIGAVAVTSAQKIKLVSGDLKFLKTAKEINTVYSYEGMAVGKFKIEADYIAKKTKEYNEKEPGRGDSWAKSWVNDRATRFQPKFEELINEKTKKMGCTFMPNAKGAEYTMKVRTTFTEPGFNIAITRQPAMINLEITFEAGGAEKAKITLTGAPGNTFGGYDFDTGVRIGEAYAKAGKSLAAFLEKKMK